MNLGHSILFLSITITLQFFSLQALAADKLWVTADRTNRYSCPSIKCGIAGHLMFRESVDAFEKKGIWVRITKAYSASCVKGESEYIKEGNKACTNINGIKDGRFSEWVQLKDLSDKLPADPAENADGDYLLVKGSDDYRIHKDIFAKAARKLITEGICSETDFQDMGGWMASTNRGAGIYFTYCGGMSMNNKIYLNAMTGMTSK